MPEKPCYRAGPQATTNINTATKYVAVDKLIYGSDNRVLS